MQTITTISLARLKSQDIVKRYSLEMTFKGYLLCILCISHKRTVVIITVLFSDNTQISYYPCKKISCDETLLEIW